MPGVNTQPQETEQDPENLNDADALAAFQAGFDGKDLPPATQPTEKPAAEASQDGKPATPASAATATADAEIDPARTAAVTGEDDTAATAPKDGAPPKTEPAQAAPPTPATQPQVDMAAEVRKLYGRIGQLTDEVKQLKTGKEAEGKPAVATRVELKRLAAEYPDLAPHLTEDLAEVLTGLGGAKADPKQVEELVQQRVQEGIARETARMREAMVNEMVEDVHPNWQADVFAVDAAGRKAVSADYAAWRATLGAEQAQAFESSTNPHLVIRRLGEFYAFKAKAASEAAAKQQRLKQAVTPQGVPRASPQTMSEDEAMRKGFEAGFNS